MVMHSICSISACHSLHTSNPSPHPSASPAPRAPSTLLALLQREHGSRLGQQGGGLSCRWSWHTGILTARKSRIFFCLNKVLFKHSDCRAFFFSPPRCHYIPFCFDFKCCHCNCWEEFLVLNSVDVHLTIGLSCVKHQRIRHLFFSLGIKDHTE